MAGSRAPGLRHTTKGRKFRTVKVSVQAAASTYELRMVDTRGEKGRVVHAGICGHDVQIWLSGCVWPNNMWTGSLRSGFPYFHMISEVIQQQCDEGLKVALEKRASAWNVPSAS